MRERRERNLFELGLSWFFMRGVRQVERVVVFYIDYFVYLFDLLTLM